jgi:acetylornithine/succinyldiaminopimelate/putrescine aminotransferase
MHCAAAMKDPAMAAADRELRTLKRDLLLARAAVQRAQLAHQLDRLQGRTHGVRHLAGSVLGTRLLSSAPLLMAAANAVRFVRRQPWVVPTVVTSVARLSRTRTLRWVVLAGVVAAAAWWIRQARATAAAAPGSSVEPLDPGNAQDGNT